MDQFKACIEIIEVYSGTLGAHPGVTKDILAIIPGVDISTYPSVVTSDKFKVARNKARERCLACLFISGDCNIRYGFMKRYFHNEYLKDKDTYPIYLRWI